MTTTTTTQQPAGVPPSSGAKREGHDAAPKQQLKRACDCCRKRKVRCDGQDPCTPCKKASIRCAYLAVPKKKGPKGLRSARVLHALRRIDHDASSQAPSSAGSLSPNQTQPFGSNWGWGTNGSVPPGASPSQAPQGQEIAYGQPTASVAPDQRPYHQQLPPSMPHIQPVYAPQVPLVKHEPAPHQETRPIPPNTQQSESIAAGSEAQSQVFTPMSSELYSRRAITPEAFMPFVQLFFQHMFPIMPVFDRSVFLDPYQYSNHSSMSSEMYALLCALCATTVVQLDESIPQPPSIHPSKKTDAFFAEECLRERMLFDYPEQATSFNLMTSFLLFCYYGNHENHNRAWYFLQESITFSENMSCKYGDRSKQFLVLLSPSGDKPGDRQTI